MSEQDLFLAIHAEHEQRTRHSVFRQGQYDTTRHSCEVCLYLDAYKRDMDQQFHEAYSTPAAPQGAEGEG